MLRDPVGYTGNRWEESDPAGHACSDFESLLQRYQSEPNNVEVVRSLAHRYYTGNGVEQDIEEGCALYVKAANEMGDLWSKEALGDHCWEAEEYQNAASWYQAPANQGYVHSAYRMALISRDVYKNFPEALDYFLKAIHPQYRYIQVVDRGRPKTDRFNAAYSDAAQNDPRIQYFLTLWKANQTKTQLDQNAHSIKKASELLTESMIAGNPFAIATAAFLRFLEAVSAKKQKVGLIGLEQSTKDRILSTFTSQMIEAFSEEYRHNGEKLKEFLYPFLPLNCPITDEIKMSISALFNFLLTAALEISLGKLKVQINAQEAKLNLADQLQNPIAKAACLLLG